MIQYLISSKERKLNPNIMPAYKKKSENPTTKSMSTVKSHIENRTFSRIYLLFGEESYLVNQYRDTLVNALVSSDDTMNLTSYSTDTFNVDSVADDMITMPFFADYRVVLVEDSGIFDKSNETEIEKMLAIIPQMSDANVLILCEKKVDKRKKLYTSLKKNEAASLLEFSTPDMGTLSKWVTGLLSEGGLKIRATVPDLLISTVGNDMNTLKNEATKLHDYCMERGEVNDADVRAVCVNPVEDKIFVMCEAISKKDSAKAISLYTDLLILKTKPMTIIYLISRQYNILLQVSQLLSEGAPSSKIASFLNMSPSFAGKYISICKNYTYHELVLAADKCQQADIKIKTGELTDTNSSENLIINLLN